MPVKNLLASPLDYIVGYVPGMFCSQYLFGENDILYLCEYLKAISDVLTSDKQNHNVFPQSNTSKHIT